MEAKLLLGKLAATPNYKVSTSIMEPFSMNAGHSEMDFSNIICVRSPVSRWTLGRQTSAQSYSRSQSPSKKDVPVPDPEYSGDFPAEMSAGK